MLIVKNARRAERSLSEQKDIHTGKNYLSEKTECNRAPLQNRRTNSA